MTVTPSHSIETSGPPLLVERHVTATEHAVLLTLSDEELLRLVRIVCIVAGTQAEQYRYLAEQHNTWDQRAQREDEAWRRPAQVMRKAADALAREIAQQVRTWPAARWAIDPDVAWEILNRLDEASVEPDECASPGCHHLSMDGDPYCSVCEV